MRRTAFSTMALSGFFWLAFAGSASAAPVTLTGCLEKGDEPDEFRLSHATGGDAEQYELVAGEGVSLDAHVGHKVQITGEKANSNEGKETAHEHLEVSALKHIAAKCP